MFMCELKIMVLLITLTLAAFFFLKKNSNQVLQLGLILRVSGLVIFCRSLLILRIGSKRMNIFQITQFVI
jgi:hypothetical protein